MLKNERIGEKMKGRERIRRPLSDGELQRRWSLVRNLLKDKNLDCVIVQNTNMHLGGYVRWFTDVPAEYNLPMTAIFPVDDEMTLIRSSASTTSPYPPAWAARGVKKVLNAPFSPTLYYTGEIEAGLAAGVLRERAPKAVGIVGRAHISAGFLKRLKEQFPAVDFVDITEEIDLFKALKSEEEMARVREITKIQDMAWAALPSVFKVGMTEYQVRSALQELMMNQGNEEHLMFIGTAQPGKPAGMAMHNFAGRRIREGDYGVLLIEVSGPGGYYAESARNFCFGEPYKELADAWDAAVEGQQLTADLLTPGRDSREIVREYNKLMAKKGYSLEGRLYGHSQGYDLIERPAFMADSDDGVETMPIQAGMNCSLHPFITNDVVTVYINDNYYVTENGAEKLHKTPPEIILI